MTRNSITDVKMLGCQGIVRCAFFTVIFLEYRQQELSFYISDRVTIHGSRSFSFINFINGL